MSLPVVTCLSVLVVPGIVDAVVVGMKIVSEEVVVVDVVVVAFDIDAG